MRSSRREPTGELKRHALPVALPLDESYREHSSLPGVRCNAAEQSVCLL